MEVVTTTKACYHLTAVPLYTYPIKWNVNDAHAPFIKVILPWQGSTPSATDQKPTEFYYKIMIPEETQLTSNTCYNISLDLSVLGSEADDVPVEVSGNYYAVDWNEAEEMGGDTHAGRYLKIGQTTFEMFGDELEIPVKSSHDISIVTNSVSSSYPRFGGNNLQPGSLTLSENSATGTNFMLTPNGRKSLTLSHVMVKGVDNFGNNGVNAKDVAPITYKFKIQHSDDSSYITEEITVIQYPSIYISQEQGMNVFIDGFFQFLNNVPTGYANYITVGNGATRGYRSAQYVGDSYRHTNNPGATNQSSPSWNSQIKTPYGNLYYNSGSIVDSESKLTLITVTTFGNASTYTMGSDTYQYTITDPRVKPNWRDREFTFEGGRRFESSHLVPYLVSHQNNNGNFTAWTETQEAAILVGGDNTLISSNLYAAPIAPSILISSRWGRPGSGDFPVTIQQAQQRCATYQEAGYPAGRWRLPTEAEINFVYKLQQKGLVGEIFTTGGYGYWASSGRYFGGDSGTATFLTPNANGRNTSIRCVYDYWYWGDDKVDVYKYTPKP